VFDGDKQEKTDISIEIPQGLPVSPILFLIYIRDIFKGLEGLKIRSLSYIDNISLTISLKLIKNNCILLKRAAEILFERGKENVIQFNMGKTELIYFYLKRIIIITSLQRRASRSASASLHILSI
jgi:hypothetical protein